VLTMLVFGVGKQPAPARPASMTASGGWRVGWVGVAVGAVSVLSLIGLLLHVGISGERSFLPLIASQRGRMTTDQIGVLVATLSLVQALLMVPMGGLSDRFGRRPIMLLGLVGGSAGLVLYPLATAAWQFYPIAVLRAVALAATWPALLALVSDATPLRSQGRVHGVFGTVEDIGLITGPAAGGFIWATFGLGATFYFQAFFVGLGAIVVALFWRLLDLGNRSGKRNLAQPAQVG
jgi:MFS family permease